MINPVILSGGSGTRLWPLSRASYPKQFLPLVTEKSLFQETLIRLKNNYLDVDEPIIIGNQEHRFLIAEQCRLINVKPNSIILEPFGRNTAAAIATACLNVQNKKGDGILLVMPADHVIENTTAFLDSIKKAISVADQDKIVTFGIAPKYAETGYGYIRVKEKSQYIQKVDAFVEKPDKKTANQYLIDGRYYWNAGIFLFKASAMIAEIEKYSPLVLDSVKKAFDNSKEDADFLRLDSDCFSQVPDISIDYAVMEKSNNVSVMPLDAEWSDVGCWNSVWNISKKDNNNNVIRGNVISEDSENCYIRAESRLVSLLGVNDLIVIETSDALMVAKKDKAQDVKKIVEIAKNNKKPQATIHRKVYRPWGYYDSIDVGDRYQVKRIQVAPGQKLSVQMHHHRAEHWVVVAGTARIFLDGKEKLLTENQSIYIPIGGIHALENPGKIPLDMIEVQSGSYLSEDDIVRFEDKYGRA